MTCASSAKRSRMLPPVDVIPALSSALRYSRATDLRCSSVMVCLATAMVGVPLLLQSAFAVDAGHERGEVVGGEKGRRWGRTPVEQALGALKCLRGPQLVVDDAVQVGVVLTEDAGRVLRYQKKFDPAWCRPSPQMCRSGWSSSIATAPRPTSSMSSTSQEVWCRKPTGARRARTL